MTQPAPRSPLPVRAGSLSPHQFGNLTRQVMNTYKDASPETRLEGRLWYSTAHDHADQIGRGDAVKGAGVIAALSPQNRWEKNLKDASTAMRKGTAKGLHTGTQTDKAQAILDGEHPLDVLHGPKERSFFKNIADPDDPEPVTIDRHAHDIAVGKPFGDRNRGLSAQGRYDNLSEVYRRAGRRLGIERTNEVQAATWQHWTQRQGLHLPIPLTENWQT